MTVWKRFANTIVLLVWYLRSQLRWHLSHRLIRYIPYSFRFLASHLSIATRDADDSGNPGLIWKWSARAHRLWHNYCCGISCYCIAMLISIDMRDGIFSFYIRSDETSIRAIALVENDSIRGFNRSHIYFLERLKYSLDRLRKDRNTNWSVKVMEHTRVQSSSMRGFPAKLEGEEGEEQFWFEGGSDADRRVRVEIQGAWLHNLPWDVRNTETEKRLTPETNPGPECSGRFWAEDATRQE
jgi:hypothetical protein